MMEIRRIQAVETLVRVAAGSDILLFDDGLVSSLKVEVAADSRLFYVLFSNAGSQEPVSLERELIVGLRSEVSSACLWLGEGGGHLVFNSRLEGQASLTSRSLYLLTKQQKLNISERHEFIGELSRGRFFSAGLLNDQSSSYHASEVIVNPAAQDSDSRIEAKLHLLSKQARGTMLPALKISAHRVKAGHGASTAVLQPEDLFYLRSRGLSEEQAKNLLVMSTASEFIRHIPNQALGQELLDAIMKKL